MLLPQESHHAVTACRSGHALCALALTRAIMRSTRLQLAVRRAQQGSDGVALTVEHDDRLEAVFIVVGVPP
jgi:monoamine oxidase